MGILKLLVITGAGVFSARALYRLHGKVSHIAVPKLSSLAKRANQCGDIYADTFVVELPQRTALSGVPVTVSDLTRSFFKNKVFCSLEKPLLKLIFSLKEPKSLDKCEFYVGEKVLLWKVVHRGRDEILFEWQSGKFRGFTWFHVNQNQLLMFGSSIGHLDYKYQIPPTSYYSPLESVVCAIRVLKENPYHQDIFSRLKNLLLKSTGAVLGGGHQFYSRLLLASTLKTLVLEEKGL